MRLARMIVVFGLLLALSGCAGDWGTVKGTASVEGQRLKSGSVTFHPKGEGAAGYGVISTDGTFKIMTGTQEGLKSGDYTVTVVDQTIPDPDSGETVKILTPAKYASPVTTDFKVTVNPGANSFDFDLKK
jgi:hypothetical protein